MTKDLSDPMPINGEKYVATVTRNNVELINL